MAACLTPEAVQLAATDRAEAVDLPGKVAELLQTAEELLAVARNAGQGAGMLAAMREARASIELLAKLSGQLRTGDSTTVNILIDEHPEWQRIRAAMVDALQPFPEASAAVSAALMAVEGTPVPTARPAIAAASRAANGETP